VPSTSRAASRRASSMSTSVFAIGSLLLMDIS
jgi:hypothetical protein